MPGKITTFVVIPTPSRLSVSWGAPPCAVEYVIEYQLNNFDQCDDSGGPRTNIGTIQQISITIAGLYPYSTYTVFVTARNSLGENENTVLGITTERGSRSNSLILLSYTHVAHL